jgi:Lrp/AsnC family leucine-responsive transcriptional regulator
VVPGVIGRVALESAGARLGTFENGSVGRVSDRLDPIDASIVDALCVDGRATYQELGKVVGLSPTATADRVRRLRRDGVITGFRAVVDAGRLGRTVEAAIDVRLVNGADREDFSEVLRAQPAIVEAVHVTGHYDYMLRVFCTGTAELDQILSILKNEAGVVESQTRLLLHRIADLDQLGPSLEGAPPGLPGGAVRR